jgi:hypothetical protein
MTTCAVENCQSDPVHIIDLNQLPGREVEGALPMQWVVCDFHNQALIEGETFDAVGDDHRTIRLGTQTPPRLISFTTEEGTIGDTEITLEVGHDGIVSQKWTFLANGDFAWYLIDESLDDDSELSKEFNRNQARED